MTSNSSPRYTPERNENMSIQILVPEYSQQHYNSQNVANNLNVHWLMNRLNVVGIPTQQTVIWPLKKNEVLIHATMWLNLGGKKNTQWKRPDTRGYIIPLTWNVQKRQIHREKRRLVLVKGWRRERSRKWLLAGEVLGFFLGNESILKLDSEDRCINFVKAKNCWIIHFAYMLYHSVMPNFLQPHGL